MTFKDLVLFEPKESFQEKVALVLDSDGSLEKGAARAKEGRASLVGIRTSDRMRALKAISSGNSADFLLPDLSRVWIDKSIATLSKKNGCPVAISFSQIVSNPLEIRKEIGRAKQAVEILDYYNTPSLFATFAERELLSRDKGDLAGVLEILGAKDPGRMLSLSSELIKGKKGEIFPGVRIVEENEEREESGK